MKLNRISIGAVFLFSVASLAVEMDVSAASLETRVTALEQKVRRLEQDIRTLETNQRTILTSQSTMQRLLAQLTERVNRLDGNEPDTIRLNYRSFVDLSCLEKKDDLYTYVPSFDTLSTWLESCRKSPSSSFRCIEIDSSGDAGCVTKADDIYTYSFTDREIEQVFEACKVRNLRCEAKFK